MDKYEEGIIARFDWNFPPRQFYENDLEPPQFIWDENTFENQEVYRDAYLKRKKEGLIKK